MQEHKVYLKICEELSNLSKCRKHQVGALIVKDKRIISNGVNGTVPGFTNCCEHFKNVNTRLEPGRTEHRKWSEKFEIHAEQNAILFAAKNGVNINNSILYCNLEPCFNCLKYAISAGVKEIYYSNIHKTNLKSKEAKKLIQSSKIKIYHIK